MITYKSIFKEIKEIPVNRLEELQQFVNSLQGDSNSSEANRKKILSFGGAFGDLSNNEFSEFLSYTEKLRKKLFKRNRNL